MKNLTQRLIILDINTIKRTTQKVIKEKPNKISCGPRRGKATSDRARDRNRNRETKIEKHMALDVAIQQLNSEFRTQNII